MAKVSIQIVTWNSMRYIFDCLESIIRQSFRDFSILVIDNASSDGTVEFIRGHYPSVSVLQNFKNLGFCKANNQGIQLASGDYILVMNPDVILADDFLEKLISSADRHPYAGSFGGKTLKLFSQPIDQQDQEGLRKIIKSDIIDSAGLAIFKNRKVVNRGEGQKDAGQYDEVEQVFGLSGSCVLYRRKALEEVKIKSEYFDDNFFAYKEDIDLAWRLQLCGHSGWYFPEAVCYHRRSLSSVKTGGLKALVQSRRKISKTLKSASLRNHCLMLVKNDQWPNIILALPWFLFRQAEIFIYILVFELFQCRGFVKFLQFLPETLSKRKIIMANKKVKARDIRKWFK